MHSGSPVAAGARGQNFLETCALFSDNFCRPQPFRSARDSHSERGSSCKPRKLSPAQCGLRPFAYGALASQAAASTDSDPLRFREHLASIVEMPLEAAPAYSTLILTVAKTSLFGERVAGKYNDIQTCSRSRVNVFVKRSV